SDSMYRKLVELAEQSQTRQQQAIQAGEKITAGGRRTHCFKLACSLRKRGVPLEAVLRVCRGTNHARYQPTLAEHTVDGQVTGAYGGYEEGGAGAAADESEPVEEPDISETDVGLAERFADEYGDRFRFVPGKKTGEGDWYFYGGNRWQAVGEFVVNQWIAKLG